MMFLVTCAAGTLASSVSSRHVSNALEAAFIFWRGEMCQVTTVDRDG